MRPMRTMRAARSLLLILALGVWASGASAVGFGTSCISNNSAENCAIGESQLSVEVSDRGGQEVSILFSNVGVDPATIRAIYLDDNAGVLDFADYALVESDGVSFSKRGDKPKNLPGGKPIGFKSDWTAAADKPAPQHGVDPGETLELVLSLTTGTSFDDVIAALESGELMMGMHVISIGRDEESESFATPSRNAPVPEPSAGFLYAAGLMIVAGYMNKRGR